MSTVHVFCAIGEALKFACSFLQLVAATILLLVCIMSASVRLFSVIKYESVIHEFDPYFNYRVTVFLTKVCTALTSTTGLLSYR